MSRARVSLTGVSAPTFWLAFIMLAVFYGWLGWAPGPGQIGADQFPPPEVTGFMLIDAPLAGQWDTFWDAIAHLVLPSIVLASATMGLITRTTRAAMLEALSQDYIRVARAKGLLRRVIMLRHALPNALLPVVTLGGLAYAQLLTGTVLTETIFSWPGLGRYTFQSAVILDFPAIMGITLVVADRLCDRQPGGRCVLRVARSAGDAAMSPPAFGLPLTDRAAAERSAEATASGTGRRRRWLRRYLLASMGGAVIVAWLLAALLAPWITPLRPRHGERRRAPGRAVAGALAGHRRARPRRADAHHLRRAHVADSGLHRGADRRRSRHAGRRVAAYARGWAEEILMRATDLMFCFPPIILAMAIAAALGIGTRNTVIAMLVVWWPKFARLARSLVLGQRSLEYVAAARTIGFPPTHILFRQILPNAVGPLVVLVTLDLGNAILVFAGLSFLGLGVVPPTPEWGSMVSEGRELVSQWWVATFPGPGDPDRGDRLQLRGRRPARLARPACPTTLTCRGRSRHCMPVCRDMRY